MSCMSSAMSNGLTLPTANKRVRKTISVVVIFISLIAPSIGERRTLRFSLQDDYVSDWRLIVYGTKANARSINLYSRNFWQFSISCAMKIRPFEKPRFDCESILNYAARQVLDIEDRVGFTVGIIFWIRHLQSLSITIHARSPHTPSPLRRRTL